MIVFDLQCAANAHVFEGWFGSSTDFEDQRTRKLIACPICGDADVTKAIMAPNVAAKGNTQTQTLPALPVAKPAPSAPESKALLAALAKVQAMMLEKSTWVGKKFADQARAMDAGDSPHTSIYGEVTPTEAKELIEDGIGVMPLPLPVTPPDQLN